MSLEAIGIIVDDYDYYSLSANAGDEWSIISSKNPLYITKMFPVTIGGITYKTLSHLLVYSRAVAEGSEEIIEKFKSLKSEKARVTLVSSLVSEQLEDTAEWEIAMPQVFYTLAVSSVLENEELIAQLVETGNNFIAIAAPEMVWAVGLDKTNTEKKPSHYPGQNLWGIALMRLREDINNAQPEEKQVPSKLDSDLASEMGTVSSSDKTYKEHMQSWKFFDGKSVWTDKDVKTSFLLAYRQLKLAKRLPTLLEWIVSRSSTFLSPFEFVASLPTMTEAVSELARIRKVEQINREAPTESIKNCKKCGRPAIVGQLQTQSADENTAMLITCAVCRDPADSSKPFSYTLSTGEYWNVKRVSN